MNPLRLRIEVTLDNDAMVALGELVRQTMERVPQRVAPAARACDATVGRDDNGRPSMTPQERSQHALFRGAPPPDNIEILMDTRRVAKAIGLSTRGIYNLLASGKFPRPIRIGRAVRWNVNEINAWVEAGCPNQDAWKWQPAPDTRVRKQR